MQRSILCVFFVLATIFSLSNYLYALERPQYTIKAEIDVENKEISARQEVVFHNNSDDSISEVYFHIYANRNYTKEEIHFLNRFAGYFKINPYPEGFQQGKVNIKSILCDSNIVDYFVEGKDRTLLKISLKQKISPGESIVIIIDYDVSLPHAYGRFGWHKNIIKLSQWYPVLCVYDEDGWNKNLFYPYHRPFYSDASHYNVELTVPKEQVVVHSADISEVKHSDGYIKTLFLKTSLPVRDFTIAMSRDYKIVTDNFEGIKLNSFYLKGDIARAKEAIRCAKDLMKFYSQRFGNYPYKEFSIAPVYLGYGGEQMSNLIFIDTRVYKLPNLLSRYFDFLIAHETGHQWFYNVVGVNEDRYMWLEEGINSYFLLEYLQNKYGKDSSILDYPGWFERWSWLLPELTFDNARDFRYRTLAKIGYDHSIIGPISSFKEPSTIFSITYGKGARVTGMLKALVGEETFYSIFKRIFNEYKFRNINIDDFVKVCEEESKLDLSDFFEQWLFTDKKLDYAIRRKNNRTFIIEKRGEIEMPVNITVDYMDGQQSEISLSEVKDQEEINLEDISDIKEVSIDKKAEYLDIDPTNNSWPRKKYLHLVPLYLGLYEIPAFLPDDGYNFVLGPDLSDSGLGVKVSVQKPYDQILYSSTNYEINEELHHSMAGYQLKNLFESPTVIGVEIANTTDLDGGEEDLVSGKVYIRRELWPVQYGLTDINEHITVYLIRNQGLKGSGFIDGKEDVRNIEYSRKQESIIGTALHINRSGPYPSPTQGYKLDSMFESSGHFLGATQYFYRSAFDLSGYYSVCNSSVLALRLKYGWGYPEDKDLFRIGGIDGLRGYKRKTIRGSNSLIGSIEYRFAIVDDINLGLFDNIFYLSAIDGVLFFDAGQAWYDEFKDSRLRKDGGLGIRFKVNVGAFLEKVIIRVDAAKAINDSAEDTKFWFSINHSF